MFFIRGARASSSTLSPCYILHKAFSYFSINSSFSWIRGTNLSSFLVKMPKSLLDYISKFFIFFSFWSSFSLIDFIPAYRVSRICSEGVSGDSKDGSKSGIWITRGCRELEEIFLPWSWPFSVELVCKTFYSILVADGISIVLLVP